jgi:hypothetical protein
LRVIESRLSRGRRYAALLAGLARRTHQSRLARMVRGRRGGGWVVAMALGAAAGCDNWPIQKDAGVGGGEVPPVRDAALACTTLAPVRPSASPQVNAALCFGIAIGSSDTLECAPSATAGVIQCVDGLLGDAYVVRWSGNDARVLAGFDGRDLGSVRVLGSATFAVTTAGELEGTCSFSSGPPARVELCLQE